MQLITATKVVGNIFSFLTSDAEPDVKHSSATFILGGDKMKPYKLCFRHGGVLKQVHVYARSLKSAKKTAANLYYVDQHLIKEVLA